MDSDELKQWWKEAKSVEATLDLNQPVRGYWDMGPKTHFRFQIDYHPIVTCNDVRMVRVGSYEANNWFLVKFDKEPAMVLKNALTTVRRRMWKIDPNMLIKTRFFRDGVEFDPNKTKKGKA